jgi:tetratricopeptide (TPR) repeat protein
MVSGLFLLGLAEGVLRLAGMGNRARRLDPFVGFERVYPLWVESKAGDGRLMMATAPNKLPFFNHQEFSAKKAPGTVRIFCFGGSTTYGRPYRGETAFPRWLAINLQLQDPDHRYEVINAGGISYASYRVAHLVEEALRYEPDVFVLYCGHNEFLEARTYDALLRQPPVVRKARLLMDRSALYAALRPVVTAVQRRVLGQGEEKPPLKDEVSAILDASAGLERYSRQTLQREQTYAHYRYNLERMVALARQHHVKMLLATLPTNLKDFSPFKSEHREPWSQEQQEWWDEHFRAGIIAGARGGYEQALAAYQQCYQLDDQYAELAYRIGCCLHRLGHFDLAKQYLLLARELDVCPLRAPGEINRIIRDVASRYGLALVDVEEEFARRSPQGVMDSSLLLDHVHPTVRGHQLIAELLVQQMQRLGWVPAARAVTDHERLAAYERVMHALPPDYYLEGTLNLAKVLGWAGKEEEKLALLRRHQQQLQGHAEFHYMMGNSMLRRGEVAEATREFRRCIELSPSFANAYTNLGMALEQSGDAEGARAQYLKALSLAPQDYVAQANLGRLAYLRGDNRAAIAAFRKAIALNGEYADAYSGLGVVYHHQGYREQAVVQLQKALQKNPGYAEAYYNLGLIYLEEGRLQQAMEAFRRAIACDPLYADAHCSLGVCFYQMQDLPHAVSALQTALRLNPRLGKAHNNLAVAYYTMGDLRRAWDHVRAAQQVHYDVDPAFLELLRTEGHRGVQGGQGSHPTP